MATPEVPPTAATPADVLDLFAVPPTTEPLAGGQGRSVRAGDLVLSPGRDARELAWLAPVQARLAVDLDTRAGRHPRDLRMALPVPARDGSWVVGGWAATRFEPGCVPLTALDALLATAAALHAELGAALPDPPATPPCRTPMNRWQRAAAVAFGDLRLGAFDAPSAAGARAAGVAPCLPEPVRDLVAGLLAQTDDTDLGPDRLVHGDLANNVLLTPQGAPLVIDIAPYWRPSLWADAVLVLDTVLWHDADPAAMRSWRSGAPRQAMLRAGIFRLLSDLEPDVGRYGTLLAP